MESLLCFPFVKSSKVQTVLYVSKRYNQLPSAVMHIEDDYTAFCFDEACAEIIARIEAGEKPIWEDSKQEQKSYSKFSDLYKKY